MYEERWDMVRSHFATVRRLIANDEEIVKTLDSTFGADWRLEPPCTINSDEPTTCEKGQKSKTPALEDIYPITAVVPRASHTATAQPDPPDDGESDFNAIPTPNNLHDDAVEEDHIGLIETHNLLNHNAPAFHSRTSVLISEGSPNYSPSRHVASFLSELSTTSGATPNESSVDPKPLSTSYSEPGNLKFAVFPTSSLERESVKTAGLRGGKSAKQTSKTTSAAHNPLSSTSQDSKTSLSGPSPAAPSTSSIFSPPITFCLESREDMIRRRNAAPHAFFAAASPLHRGGAAYFSPGAVMGPSPAKASGEPIPNDLPNPTEPHNLSGAGAGSSVGTLYTPGRNGASRSLPISPVLAFNSPSLLPQCPYDYLLVLDFEATCEEHMPPGYLHEIVEFPVVLVDTKLYRVMAEFHRFVRPRHKPQLSEFCRSLTGIQQQDIDAAAPLEVVVAQFERWHRQTIPPNARAIFATDGPADFREFMYHHSVTRQGIHFPAMFYQWIDIKKSFAAFFNSQQGKIKAMLDALQMSFKGRLHNGLDDARNLANIVIGLLQRGCTFCEVPLSRLSPGTPFTRNGGAVDIPGGSLFLPPSAVSIGATTPGSNSNNSFTHPKGEIPCFVDHKDGKNH
ncbi:unnamed protein product [Phytomonas sp. Hart1]|nr:unnamed protein product [Phytomonas sp. Hart1]|eukprot:CCW67440.1 unnamed protein product [Phytomonas sp. isolate Hart1]